MTRARIGRLVALGVIVASLVYPLCAWLLARSVPGYSHLHQQISELGVSTLPFAWVLTVVLVIDALLVLGLAGVVHFTFDSHEHDRRTVWVLALYALVLAIGGLFPCDEGCRPTSLPGIIHVVNVLPSMIAIVGAPFLLSRTLSRSPSHGLLSTLCWLVGGLTVVALAAAMFAFPLLGLPGLGQRVLLGLQLSFFVLASIAVVHAHRSKP